MPYFPKLLIPRKGMFERKDKQLHSDYMANSRSMEKWVQQLPVPEIEFSYPLSLTTTISPRWIARYNLTIVEFIGTLDTAGTSNTVVNLLKNGSTVASITFPSGSHGPITTGDINPPITVLKNSDYLQVQVGTVGSGTPGALQAHARFG